MKTIWRVVVVSLSTLFQRQRNGKRKRLDAGTRYVDRCDAQTRNHVFEEIWRWMATRCAATAFVESFSREGSHDADPETRRKKWKRNGREKSEERDGRQTALSGLRRSSFFSSRLVLAALPASGFGGSRHSSTAFYLTLETRRCRATFRVYGKCSTERNRNASERSSKNKASRTGEDGENQGKRESQTRGTTSRD